MNSNSSDSVTRTDNAASIIDINTGTSITADNKNQPVTNANSKVLSKRKPGQSFVPPTVAAVLLAKWNLDLYLRHFSEVTGAGRSYIQRSLEAPARNPSGAMSNTTRFASMKTNQTVTTESDLTELPTVLMCERSDDVFFYVEQPQRLELSFEDGRRSIMTTPDFLIFFREGPCICECKPERELAALVIKQPHRYQVTPDGHYSSKPAEAAAAALGLSFRFLTERSFEKIFLRNIDFLAVHYRSELRNPITDAEMAALRETLLEKPGAVMAEIPIAPDDRRADVVYSLIAHRSVFAHLDKVSLKEHESLRLYLHPVEETAFALFHGRLQKTAPTTGAVCRLLPIGSKFRLGKHSFTVLKHKADAVEVRRDSNKQEETIPYQTLHAACPTFDTVGDSMLPIWDLVGSLSTERRKEFLNRWRLIRPYLAGDKNLPNIRKERTIRRYLEAYRKEQAASGCGERALIPPVRQRSVSTVCQESNDCLNTLLKEEFLGKVAPNGSHIHRRYVKECEKLGLPECEILSSRTVARRIESISAFQKACKRYGIRAALGNQPPRGFDSLLGSQNNLGPWARAHIDHTPLDLLCKNPATGEFERPYVSAMVDGYDGRILAMIVWFGNPCAKVVFDLVQECIGRHGVLPLAIVCDWGSDFRSKDFQKDLARLGISLRYRPKGQPRHGAPVETSFSSINKRFIHNASGNTKALKNPRETTAQFLPEKSACWGFDPLKEILEDYVKMQNNAPREHKLSPNELCQAYMAKNGNHRAQWVPASILQTFRRIQVPGDTRTVSQKGTVRVNGADYSAEELKDFVGKEPAIFCDDDPRFVFVEDRQGGRQIPCECVTVGVGDAPSAAEARRAVAERMGRSYERVKAAQKLAGDFTDKLHRMEQSQKAAIEMEKKKPSPPALEAPHHNLAILSPDEIAVIWAKS